jgi:hypothetical protein
MNLPITIKDLNFILECIKYKNKNLYANLWSYKMNYLNKNKNIGESNEFS